MKEIQVRLVCGRESPSFFTPWDTAPRAWKEVNIHISLIGPGVFFKFKPIRHNGLFAFKVHMAQDV